MKIKSSKAVIGVIILLVFLLVLVSCGRATHPYINFESLPLIINNADRTLEPMELRVGESFNDMRLITIFYETDYYNGVQIPNQAHFEGEIPVNGIIEVCKETGAHYLFVDEDFRMIIPTFNIERSRPYVFMIFDIFDASAIYSAGIRTDIILDPLFLSGRRVTFWITKIANNAYVDSHDVIFGRMWVSR